MKKLLLIFLLFACKSSSDEKMHTKSVETHNLAIKIGEHVSNKIEQIGIHAESLEEPIKSLLRDSALALNEDYLYWESTIVEVPGHEHDGHDHSEHDHTQIPDLTAEMVLDIQRDIRDRIVKLNIRAQKILETLNKENNNEPAEEKEKASSYGA